MHISDIADRNAFSNAQRRWDNLLPEDLEHDAGPLDEGEAQVMNEIDTLLKTMDKCRYIDLNQPDYQFWKTGYNAFEDLWNRLNERKEKYGG